MDENKKCSYFCYDNDSFLKPILDRKKEASCAFYSGGSLVDKATLNGLSKVISPWSFVDNISSMLVLN